jgi:hypothetical protein
MTKRRPDQGFANPFQIGTCTNCGFREKDGLTGSLVFGAAYAGPKIPSKKVFGSLRPMEASIGSELAWDAPRRSTSLPSKAFHIQSHLGSITKETILKSKSSRQESLEVRQVAECFMESEDFRNCLVTFLQKYMSGRNINHVGTK